MPCGYNHPQLGQLWASMKPPRLHIQSYTYIRLCTQSGSHPATARSLLQGSLARRTSVSTQADVLQSRPHLCAVLQALSGCAVPRPVPFRAAGIADILAAPAVASVVARTLSAPAHDLWVWRP